MDINAVLPRKQLFKLRSIMLSLKQSSLLSLIIASSILLAACGTTNGTGIGKIKPVCDALIGPIHYDSRDPRNARYAGRALAPDLAARNKVGAGLGCPAYR